MEFPIAILWNSYLQLLVFLSYNKHHCPALSQQHIEAGNKNASDALFGYRLVRIPFEMGQSRGSGEGRDVRCFF